MDTRPAALKPGRCAVDERPILFVGDIQGCARELALLLEQAGFTPGVHRLLPVGDTINRGPDAAGVMTLLEDAGAEPILGNHERALLEIHQGGDIPEWAEGPRSAFRQLREAGQWERAIARIAEWPLWREGPDWLIAHAGLHPRLPPQETSPEFLTEVRWCDGEGRRPVDGPRHTLKAPPGFPPWFEHYAGEKTVVFGHWAVRGLVVQNRLRGLDTGCVYGRELTGLWWPEDRVVQVPAAQIYRPVPPSPPKPTG